MEQAIELANYNKQWLALFEAEKQRLTLPLRNQLVEIAHVGSTSIEGLAAKPIIDIAVLIKDIALIDQLVGGLEQAGYDYHGEFGLPGRQFFTRGTPRIVHVHLVDSNSSHWHMWHTFRDALRGNNELRETYQELKQGLAEKFKHDRASYTAGKSDFVMQVVAQHG